MSYTLKQEISTVGKDALRIKEAKELLNSYRTADIFEQSRIAVDFVEMFATDLIERAVHCSCDHKSIKTNATQSVELLEEEMAELIGRLKGRLENGV